VCVIERLRPPHTPRTTTGCVCVRERHLVNRVCVRERAPRGVCERGGHLEVRERGGHLVLRIHLVLVRGVCERETAASSYDTCPHTTMLCVLILVHTQSSLC